MGLAKLTNLTFAYLENGSELDSYNSRSYKLRVELKDFLSPDSIVQATYSNFHVSPKKDNYKLFVMNWLENSTLSDALIDDHHGMNFRTQYTTPHNEFDCPAARGNSGWWFPMVTHHFCGKVNLNGKFYERTNEMGILESIEYPDKGIYWEEKPIGKEITLKSVVMAIYR